MAWPFCHSHNTQDQFEHDNLVQLNTCTAIRDCMKDHWAPSSSISCASLMPNSNNVQKGDKCFKVGLLFPSDYIWLRVAAHYMFALAWRINTCDTFAVPLSKPVDLICVIAHSHYKIKYRDIWSLFSLCYNFSRFIQHFVMWLSPSRTSCRTSHFHREKGY